MGLFLKLSSLALRPVLTHTCELLNIGFAEATILKVTDILRDRFSDQSKSLTWALQRSNTFAWKSLEIALGGRSFLQRIADTFATAEHRAFWEQVKAFIESVPMDEIDGVAPDFRQSALKELQAARKAGLMEEQIEMSQLAQETAFFARFSDPKALADADLAALAQAGDGLSAADYPNLRRLLSLRPMNGQPLLITAARYYLRRAIETDEELFRGMAMSKLDGIESAQARHFAVIETAIDKYGQQITQAIEGLRIVVEETHDAVLDMRDEQRRQGGQLGEMYEAVIKLKERLDLSAANVHPRDSLSIRGDSERQMVRALLQKFRTLPADQQRQMPAMLNGLGMLQVAAGDFEPAQQVFQEVAAAIPQPKAQAQAHHNAYRAALERRNWTEALKHLCQAVRLDAANFEPFPFDKYDPQSILGAGGFGTAFLCRHRTLACNVVVKTLLAAQLQRDVDDFFREARVLEELAHPAIIRVRDLDYSRGDSMRPFFVMDYFEGLNIEEYVRTYGVMTHNQMVEVAKTLADAVGAAHAKGILHRDIKPRNVLIKRIKDDSGKPAAEPRLEVKLIDFGLAMKQDALAASSIGSHTLMGSSIAGTQDYAAPEQMGKLPDVSVGPYSDIYGFGKTCCYALFRVASPLMQHWKKVPEPLAELLNQCLSEDPKERPQDFATLLKRLNSLGGPPKLPTLPPPVGPGARGPAMPPPLPVTPGNRAGGAVSAPTAVALGGPMPGAVCPPQPPVAIALNCGLDFNAIKGSFTGFLKLCIEIDGQERQISFGRQFINLLPGQHMVRVITRGIFGEKRGRISELMITIDPGMVTFVQYEFKFTNNMLFMRNSLREVGKQPLRV